jgi:AmmeMemoRadiSam system protein B
LRDLSRPEDKAWFGGTVAHAGWKYSGEVAGQTIGTIAARTTPDVVVIFSAIHTQMPQPWAVLDAYSAWQIPTGRCEVAADLRAQLLRCGNIFAQDNSFHMREHAIEVILPLVKEAFPAARILPIEVPPHPVAAIVGRKTAETVACAPSIWPAPISRITARITVSCPWASAPVPWNGRKKTTNRCWRA